jgi:hypothetical protein
MPKTWTDTFIRNGKWLVIYDFGTRIFYKFDPAKNVDEKLYLRDVIARYRE